MSKFAPILTFEEFDQIRDSLGRIVCASGGFDPIHPGHTSYIINSREYGETLVVIVCGDAFLTAKKGRPFMDLQARSMIISSLRAVDYVIPFEVENDLTVCEALRRIRPHVFTKGGDRTTFVNIPEWKLCQDLGIELELDVGHPKTMSSSKILQEWGEFWIQKNKSKI
jgi:D-beta-D-heptose 7-phosphate kinase/D-beta-D-heptose 1-phosphate adenosyltransferase